MSNGNGVSVVTDAVENVKEAATNVGETSPTPPKTP